MAVTQEISNAINGSGKSAKIASVSNMARLIQALNSRKFDLVWSALYHVTENEATIGKGDHGDDWVADILDKRRIAYISPNTSTMKALIHKTATLNILGKAGVPVPYHYEIEQGQTLPGQEDTVLMLGNGAYQEFLPGMVKEDPKRLGRYPHLKGEFARCGCHQNPAGRRIVQKNHKYHSQGHESVKLPVPCIKKGEMKDYRALIDHIVSSTLPPASRLTYFGLIKKVCHISKTRAPILSFAIYHRPEIIDRPCTISPHLYSSQYLGGSHSTVSAIGIPGIYKYLSVLIFRDSFTSNLSLDTKF